MIYTDHMPRRKLIPNKYLFTILTIYVYVHTFEREHYLQNFRTIGVLNSFSRL